MGDSQLANFTQHEASEKRDPQLKGCLHQIACREVWGVVFSSLTDGTGGW